MDDDGVDLSRLILETRKLATENAEFCDLHAQQNVEMKKLKNLLDKSESKNVSLSNHVSGLKCELTSRSAAENQLKQLERDLKKKLRDSQEEARAEVEKRKSYEEKIRNLSDQRHEFEARLKLTKSEVQNLRHQNTVVQSERDAIEARLKSLEDSTSRQKNHTKSLCLELDHLAATREESATQLTGMEHIYLSKYFPTFSKHILEKNLLFSPKISIFDKYFDFCFLIFQKFVLNVAILAIFQNFRHFSKFWPFFEILANF